MAFAWTEEKVAIVRELYAKGVPAAGIAVAIGAPTRNTVCGRIKRLGLRAKRTPAQANADQRLSHKMSRNAGLGKPRSADPVFKPLPAIVAPGSNPVTLMDRAPHQCGWVLDQLAGPATLFCGGLKELDRPYCSHHLAIAYFRSAA